MIAPNYNKFCAEAERHYFDFLRDEAERPVPAEVIDHIMGCICCREQISRLEAMLAECKEHPQAQQMATNAILKLHFSFVGKPVNCADVRPFLPNFLVPAMQIRIPTPITAHIDNCEQCREDSKKLRELGLNYKQFITLSELFADEPDADEMDCAAARKAIPTVAAMAFDRTDAKTLRHLSLCPQCRQELYEFRQMMLEQTKQDSGSEIQKSGFPCSSVRTADVFDYCVPYAIAPASDEYAKFRTSLTPHIVCCAECLDKIQQLHKTVYEIAERPESGVVTVFHVDATAQAEAESLYTGFPVRVETAKLESREPIHSEKFEPVVRLKSPSRNFRPMLKVGIPIAAMIMLTVGLFSNIHTAKGLGIARIYKAVDTVKNVHISNFDPDTQKLVYELWISKSEGLYVIKKGNKCELRDVTARNKKTKDLSSGIIEQTSLGGDALASTTGSIANASVMMPFRTPSEIPAEAKWSEIMDAELTAKALHTKVYELTWPVDSVNGPKVQRTMRIFMDTSTNLPQKTQLFIQLPYESNFTLETISIIEYPTDQEILAKAKNMSF